MVYIGRERRKYQRYDTEAQVHFYIDYRLVTKVKFRVIGECKGKSDQCESSGVTKNISVQGMGFKSDKRVKKGNTLCMEVFLPEGGRPIHMCGKVRWCKKIPTSLNEEFKYDTGVKLLTVRGKSVARTIHIDRKYQEPWSIVLDSVFGSFHRFLHKVMKKTKKRSPATIIKALKQVIK